MIGTGGLMFWAHILSFDYFGAVLDIYIALFGLLSVILECKDIILPAKWVNTLKADAKFIYKPYGRAIMYIFFGILLISQQAFYYLCNGFYLCSIGALIVYFSSQAQKALDNFKSQKLSFPELKKAFESADNTNTGLTPPQLAAVVSKFPGCTLSQSEIESAIGLLDKDENGKVTYNEFSKWYNDR